MTTRFALTAPPSRADPGGVPGARTLVRSVRSVVTSQSTNAPLAMRWQVRLLGAVELRCGDVRLTRMSSRAITALMASLAMQPQQRHSRERLTELLWPGVAPDVGRNRFRSALSTLRSLLEPQGCVPGSVLSADRLTVQWRPDTLDCDVVDFERLARSDRAATARRLYGGALLPGFYDDWIVAERDRLEALADRLPAASPAIALAPLADEVAVAGPRPWRPPVPAGMGSFLGRADDLRMLHDAMQSHRLVTLCGMPGVGKTRLAVELARCVADRWQVHFVALADCTTAVQVVDRLAVALRVAASGPDDETQRLDQLAARLGDEPTWIVLDNFEQLVEHGGVRVVEELLERIPRLRLLITSRRALQLNGECIQVLSPLAIPAGGVSLVEAARSPAVAVFVDRVRDVRRDFQLCERNAADVIHICLLLDGLPLALELAAGRARAFSLSDMRSALEQGPTTFLRRPSRLRPGDRHGSLHEAMVRSWRLLGPAQQRLAASLTVLRGSWTVAVARAVSGQQDAHELLESLVTDSLVQATDDGDGGLRFTMPESVRAFANELKLAADRSNACNDRAASVSDREPATVAGSRCG